MKRYPRWEPTYSGEEFDRVQSLACALTDKDRRSGKHPAGFGYGLRQADRAQRIVNSANKWVRRD